jgi:hypothetical protein
MVHKGIRFSPLDFVAAVSGSCSLSRFGHSRVVAPLSVKR